MSRDHTEPNSNKRKNLSSKENVPKRRLLDINIEKGAEEKKQSKFAKSRPPRSKVVYSFDSLPYSQEIHETLLSSEVCTLVTRYDCDTASSL